MNLRFILFLSALISTGFLHTILGQQTPVFANYSYNSVVFNPAHAGFYKSTDIIVSASGYLNGFEGSPRTIGLSINTPMSSKNVGLGAGVYSDQIGVSRMTNIFGAYSYKLFLNSDRSTWWDYNPHVLSFGITGGFIIYGEDLLALEIKDDPNFAKNINTLVPTIGAGVFYNREQVYIGFSAPNLLGSSLSSENNVNITSPFYLLTGYRFFATRFREILINPSMLFKYSSGAPIQVDVNMKVNFKNKFEVGVGYRTNTSVNFLAGFRISNNCRVTYNYNQALKNNPTSMHGIVLNIRLKEGFSFR
ncbi:PorP/SprF family type IX secretion system membrane protein [Tenacibaculum sp. nBUS_03]|uniref:PorP/SprF family type IX secretion system membrane protein n=1 Tax=Tenacibaculum sp. nBUS_03 TaxID=3395320 RepID=UPI003EBD80DD